MKKTQSIFIVLFIFSSSIFFVEQGMACDCSCSTDSPPTTTNKPHSKSNNNMENPPANAPSSSPYNYHRRQLPEPPASSPSNYQMQPPVGSPMQKPPPSNKLPPSLANPPPPPPLQDDDDDDDDDQHSNKNKECWHEHSSSLSCHPQYVAFLERNRPVSMVCCNVILDAGMDCSGPIPRPYRRITEHCTHRR